MTGTHSITFRRRRSSRSTGFSRATFTGQREKSQWFLTGNLHGPAWEASGESDAPPTQGGGAWGANRRCDGNICVRPCTRVDGAHCVESARIISPDLCILSGTFTPFPREKDKARLTTIGHQRRDRPPRIPAP